MEKGYVLPRALIVKVIPQFKDLITANPANSLYYGPIRQMPAEFPEADKKRLTDAYRAMSVEQLVPAFQKLADFFEKEYLPKGRPSSGSSETRDGRERSAYQTNYATTTEMARSEQRRSVRCPQPHPGRTLRQPMQTRRANGSARRYSPPTAEPKHADRPRYAFPDGGVCATQPREPHGL